jgi:hypothetical protein
MFPTAPAATPAAPTYAPRVAPQPTRGRRAPRRTPALVPTGNFARALILRSGALRPFLLGGVTAQPGRGIAVPPEARRAR